MNEPIEINMVVCVECDAEVPADADTCPQCGVALSIPPAVEKKESFTNQRWFIISMMVFAALFIAFPILWKSPSFGRGEKVFWTLLVTLETIVVFAAFGWVMWWSWQRVSAVW